MSARLRLGRIAAAAAGLTLALTACNYAPLPADTSAGGQAGTARVTAQGQSGSTAKRLPDIHGQVCCVPSSSGAPTLVGGISTAYNGWDTAFISWMVPHFAVASQLAELAPTRAASQQVKNLATKVDAALAPNYLKMSAMATAWGQPVPSTDPNAASGHDHGGSDNSGADNAATLTKLSGAAFDRTYLKIVIADDKAALLIAKATIKNCANPQAKHLAQEIVADVTAQISQTQQMLKRDS